MAKSREIPYTLRHELKFCERQPKFIRVLFHDGSFFMNHYGAEVKQMVEAYNLSSEKEFVPCWDGESIHHYNGYEFGYGLQVQLTQQELWRVQDLSDAGVRFHKAVKLRSL
jgi:hypothetical protein